MASHRRTARAKRSIHHDPGAAAERTPTARAALDPFDLVRAVGLTLAGVEAARKYDGSPLLTMGGCFMAGLATHESAEPGTLVIRMSLEDRPYLIDEAPETYYVTGYYEKNPVVLVRLSRIDPDALHDLLTVSWRLTQEKAGKSRSRSRHVRRSRAVPG
jgi:hypothetical protein